MRLHRGKKANRPSKPHFKAPRKGNALMACKRSYFKSRVSLRALQMNLRRFNIPAKYDRFFTFRGSFNAETQFKIYTI